MGNLVKKHLKRIAISSSDFFEILSSNESLKKINFNFPTPPKLPKNNAEAFEKDKMKVANDFYSAINKLNV